MSIILDGRDKERKDTLDATQVEAYCHVVEWQHA